MNKNKLIFYLIWAILISLGPAVVLMNTPHLSVLSNKVLLTNFIQRILGLVVFTMMFTQLVLGSFMQYWTEKYGGWIFKFHLTEGIIAYSLIFFHPIFFMLMRYYIGQGLDPFFIYTQLCIICPTIFDFYYTLGRISFWLFTTAVLAGLLRMSTPFMRAHWRKFHVINYVTFLIVGIHGLSVGTDFRTFPFFPFAVIAYGVVLYITFVKKLPQLINNLRRWLA